MFQKAFRSVQSLFGAVNKVYINGSFVLYLIADKLYSHFYCLHCIVVLYFLADLVNFITDKVWMFSNLLPTNCSFLFYSRHTCSVFVLFHCRHNVVVLYFIADIVLLFSILLSTNCNSSLFYCRRYVVVFYSIAD